MNETQRILKHYEMALNGDAWHGDPIWHILNGVSAECAAHRPLASSHSIWEIVLHMTFWESVGAKRLAGERSGLDESLNFPVPPETTEANWKKTLDGFRASNREFRKELEKLPAEKLDDLSAAGKRTFYDEAHGVIQHNVYHAGQIAVLKKDYAPPSQPGSL